MIWILIAIFIIVSFVFAMLVVTPYENEKLQRNITLYCAIIFNLIYGVFIIPGLLFLLNFVTFDYRIINNLTLIIPASIFILSFILLNILFKNKLKMNTEEYLKWNIIVVIGGFLVIILL